MFCYEHLTEGYSRLELAKSQKKKVNVPSTIQAPLIKKESEKSHVAQMVAILSGVGLGLLGKNNVFAQGYSEIKYDIQVSEPLSSSMNMIPVNATSGDMIDKVTSAFDPLINLIVGLSVPIAGVMLAAGALMVMIGQKEQGYKLLINCGMGYVLVQLTPLFLEILKMVGDAI